MDTPPPNPAPAETAAPGAEAATAHPNADPGPSDPRAASPLAADSARIGSSDAGLAANGMLRGLARAARSVLLYDTNNEAIRNFLGDYQTATRAALEFGELVLDIRPFELVREGEVVYLERDRERSLAFRMFRDGVRRLTVRPGAEWSELLRLLEILSIRYTGVRQTEDDIVTLLWKAGFKNLEIVAVEGFVPEDDEAPESDGASLQGQKIDVDARRAAGRVEAPNDWDLPVRAHGPPLPLRYSPLDPSELEDLNREDSSSDLPALCVRLVSEVFTLVRDPTDPFELADIPHLLHEIRDFLLSEGQVEPLLELARALRDMHDLDPEWVDTQLRRFADTHALQRLLHSTSRTQHAIAEAMLELLEMVPGDHLADVIRVLGQERSTQGRRMARQLIEHYAERRPEFMARQLGEANGEVAADLLRAVHHAAPLLAARLVVPVAHRPEPEFQAQLLRVLQSVDGEDLSLKQLQDLLETPTLDVRLRVYDLMVERSDRPAFPFLVQRLDDHAGSMSPDEQSAIGRALARIFPERALVQLGDWVRPQQWFARLTGLAKRSAHRQWAGVAGLGVLPEEAAEAAIRWLSTRAGERLHQHCMRTLTQRRHSVTSGTEAVLVRDRVILHRAKISSEGVLTLSATELRFEPEETEETEETPKGKPPPRAVHLDREEIEEFEMLVEENVLLIHARGMRWRFSGPGARRVHRRLAKAVTP